MGEIADDMIDDMFDAMLLDPDYDEMEHVVFVREPIKCKFCGVANYHWAQDEYGSWRLYTPTGQLHTCNKYKPKEVMHGNNS